jgi:hypothetical protein
MVAFHPNDFNAPLGVGQLADASQKFPVVFVKSTEIQVGKNVAEQDEAPEAIRFQHVAGISRATQLGPEMQIGEDESVVNHNTHHPVIGRRCYDMMNSP